MRTLARAGRVELAWVLVALFLGALLTAVFILWWPARMQLAGAEAQRGVTSPSSSDESALAQAIDRLDQRLARMESAMAVQSSRGEREPVKASAPTNGEPAQEQSAPTNLDELHSDLLQMSKRIDLLAKSLEDNHKPAFSMPTLDQIHAARRDIDWAFVDGVRALCESNPAMALERVRLMTFDDLLRKVGVPTAIRVTDDGGWHYGRPSIDSSGRATERGILLYFVGDTVSGVREY